MSKENATMKDFKEMCDAFKELNRDNEEENMLRAHFNINKRVSLKNKIIILPLGDSVRFCEFLKAERVKIKPPNGCIGAITGIPAVEHKEVDDRHIIPIEIYHRIKDKDFKKELDRIKLVCHLLKTPFAPYTPEFRRQYANNL